MARTRTLIWLVIVVIAIAGSITFLILGARSFAMKLAAPRVLVSVSPSGAGELHVKAVSGPDGTYISMYVIPAGQSEPICVPDSDGYKGPLSSAEWFHGIVWSRDGTICAVRMRHNLSNEDRDGYVAAYDFKESKAYPMTWSLLSRDTGLSAEAQGKANAQDEALGGLINSRRGAAPDLNITDRHALDNARRLTWSEWQKYENR